VGATSTPGSGAAGPGHQISKRPTRRRGNSLGLVCLLFTGDYYYGDPEPKGASYLDWHAWAEAQVKRRRRPKKKAARRP